MAEQSSKTEKIAELRRQAMALPTQPGVYLMKNTHGDIIYIGKAKNLKNRVSQYFGSDTNHTEKVRQMVVRVERFEYIVVNSEFEALVLECSLIKQHLPKYNILLKDDKGYSYIRVSPPPFSRIAEVKQKAEDGARYIGPFMSSFVVKQAVDEVNKLFLLSVCRKPLQHGQAQGRPCLNHYIGQCCAPCTGRVTETEYAERVEQAVTYLTEGGARLTSLLTKRMNDAAEALDFETAARLRDRIRAIARLNEKQKVVQSRVPQQDVMAMAKAQDTACFEVFRFENGALSDREHFFVDPMESEAELRGEFLRRYYSTREKVPPRIVIDGPIEDQSLLEQWLTKLAAQQGKKYTVKLVTPQKGEQAHLLNMCRENAAERVASRLQTGGREVAGLTELAQLLGLSVPPVRVESYDISHTAGSEPVAGMVVFKNGKPHRADYRRFQIKEATAGDDPSCLREVLTRRLNEYEEKQEEGSGFGELPDLILLDGGQAQVMAIKPLLKQRGYDIPVFGMVKDSHHRTRAIAAGGEEIAMTSHRRAFTLVATIQEEVHRYAIGYHRQKRRKLGTSLTKIEGIGEKRATALLRHFGSVSAVKDATEEQLMTVAGMTKPAAEAVRRYFETENSKTV